MRFFNTETVTTYSTLVKSTENMYNITDSKLRVYKVIIPYITSNSINMIRFTYRLGITMLKKLTLSINDTCLIPANLIVDMRHENALGGVHQAVKIIR